MTACETCGSPNVRRLRHSKRHGFDVGRCRDCHAVYVLDPPPDVERLYAEPSADREARYAARLRDDAEDQAAVLTRLGELVPVGAARGRRVLFDVGAGTGEFLALAAEQGVFEARGNDLSAATAAYARDTHGVEVTATPLGDQPPGSADAVTMWCVLAHVPDPGLFLREAHALLRPGGVLFLRTPRWCAIDTAGMGLARAGFPKVADRRVNRRHLRIHDERNLGIALSNAGFEPLDVQPVCHYGFSADAYLDTMGRGRGGARVLDGLIERGWFVRNTLFAYARSDASRVDAAAEGELDGC